ncbi:MAG: ABC transporter ATP-binding protein [Candidatus Aminicenantes bacterium]|nr:ABC transporter ATP-binding protein [Candidatus Aminicenantes bacterium]
MERPALEVKNLKFSSGSRLIVDVPYLDLRQGECLVLFGPNGAGKSTFLRLISFLQPADSGEVYYRGQKVEMKSRQEMRKKIVYLLQKPVFFRGTVGDNLLAGLKFRKLDQKEQENRLKKIAAVFQIESLLHRRPEELSGGERQQVHLARAFILEPEFLLLDEPFNGLDVQYRDRLMADFYRLRKSTGLTTILVTHLRQEAAYLGERLAVMLNGRIVQTGTPEEISARPATAEVSGLMGHEALVEGRVVSSENGLLEIAAHGQKIFASGQHLPGEKVVLTFRPEEVILAGQQPATSVRNWFLAEVQELRPLDRMILVSLDCGFSLKAFVSRASADELGLQPGKKIWAGIKASALSTWPGSLEEQISERE